MTLEYIGRDGWDRPIYKSEGRIYVDIDPSGTHPAIHTKSSNEIDGEPARPVNDTAFIFQPARDTWK